MSLKTHNKNQHNILLLVNMLFHNKIKTSGKKNFIRSKLKNFSEVLNIPLSELEHIFNILEKNNFLLFKESYLKINWSALNEFIKKQKTNSQPDDPLILQNNMEIIVKPEISDSDLFFLIQFAEFVKHDVIYKFKITKNSLHNAFSIDIAVQQITDFLTRFVPTLDDTVKFFISDVANRTGEIKIKYSGGILYANKFLIQEIKNIPEIKNNTLDIIEDYIILLSPQANLNDIYYSLKEKMFFPVFDSSVTMPFYNNFLLYINSDEAESILTAVETLKSIGAEHNIDVNFNVLSNILNRLKPLMSEKAVKKASENSKKYKKDLDKSIKSYILKTLKHSVNNPKILITNKLSEKFKGDNPAITKKSMKTMINYAIQHKLMLFVEYITSPITLKSEGMVVIPEYLYNETLIAKDKETKKKLTLELKHISYIILL